MRRTLVFSVLLASALVMPGLASAQDLSDVTDDRTVLQSGGSGDAYAVNSNGLLGGQLVVGANEIQKVWAPQEFGPVYGGPQGLSYDASRSIGIANEKEAIRSTLAEGKRPVIVDYSQSASSNSEALAQLASEGVLLDDVTVVHVANPRTPGTGLETRWAGMGVPGVTSLGAAPNVVSGYSECWVHDPICNAPQLDRMMNPVMLVDMAIGYRDYHGRYFDVSSSTRTRSYERDGVIYVTLDDGSRSAVVEAMHRDLNVWLPQPVEDFIVTQVQRSEPGPGPVAPVATTQELPQSVDPVEVVQEVYAQVGQAIEQFVEPFVQFPISNDLGVDTAAPVPSPMEQVNTAINDFIGQFVQ